MEIKAVIDIGTSSVKLFAAQKEEGGALRAVLDEALVTRLGEGLAKTGKISREAFERSAGGIALLADKARKAGAYEIAAAGTMALRSAENSKEFLSEVKRRSGLDVMILSGEEEARLSYLAVTEELGKNPESLLIFDTGGGSTEFISGGPEGYRKSFSLNFGGVTVTEAYLKSDPPSEEECENALEALEDSLSHAKLFPMDVKLIGMGGTVTSMASVKQGLLSFNPAKVRGTVLTDFDVSEQIERYKEKTALERSEIPGLQPGRAGIILGGALIVKAIMSKLSAKSLTVSERGVRHGLMVLLFSGKV